jgi:hypothetical protein
VFGDDGVLVVLDSGEEALEDGGEDQGNYRGEYGGEDDPHDDGVTFPEPELAGEVEWGSACGVEELAGGKRHRRGVKDAAAKADEGDDEEKLQRVDEMVGDLRGNDVEPEDGGYGEAEDSSGAEDRVDADKEAGG